MDGTINKRDDVDTGWTVELAFPWKGLELLADGRALPCGHYVPEEVPLETAAALQDFLQEW